MSPFTIAPNDQSLYYLNQIFGVVGSVLPNVSPDGSPALLGTMFQALNTVFLVIASLVVAYTTVIGLLATAHEGEFLGRDWSGLWVPIRTVIGVATLFPGATGYSIFQSFLMWLILQGVGAADTVWNATLSFINVTGSPYAAFTPNTPVMTVQTLLQAMTCQAEAAKNAPDTIPGTANKLFYCAANPAADFCKWGANATAHLAEDASVYTYSIGPSGNCGTLTYCNESTACPTGGGDTSYACALCRAQKDALNAILPVYAAIGNNIATLDEQYIHFYFTSSTSTAPTPPWLLNYCSVNQVLPANCCFKSNNNASPIPFVFAKSCTTNAIFYPWQAGSNDYTNANDDAFSKIYALQLMAQSGNMDYVKVALDQYNGAIVGAITAWIAKQPPASLSDDWKKTASDNGWALAGAYYYRIANSERKNIESIPTFIIPQNNPRSDPNNIMSTYRNNYTAVDSFLRNAKKNEGTPNNFVASVPSNVKGVAQIGVDSALNLVNRFIKYLDDKKQDPIKGLADLGAHWMADAQILLGVFLPTTAVLLSLSSINFMAMGFGMTSSPIWAGVVFLIYFIAAFIMALAAGLFTMGALLSIYIPLIPYVIFTLGVVGWLIAAVEGMVAGSFIAFGLLIPGGQSKVFGITTPAIMLTFQLILRPVFMLFGLMAAMLMAVVVLGMINSGFGIVMNDINGNPGLFESIIFIMAYIFLVVSAMNKTFSLIHHIPDIIFTWIGGHRADYGEREGLHEMRQRTEGTAGGVARTAEGGVGRVGGAASTRARGVAERDAKPGSKGQGELKP